jgi:hypothetical protein
LQVADELQRHANAALDTVAKLESRGNRELAATLADIEAMAWLGRYYGCKIRGATELALYRKTKKEAHQLAAIAQLTDAARHWDRYTASLTSRYKNPVWTNRVGTVDWKLLTAEVARDIEIARAPLRQ